MDFLSNAEKQKYNTLWQTYPSYRDVSPAEELVPFYLKHFHRQIKPGERLLDFGCGTGRAAKSFLSAGLSVELIDCSSQCLDEEISLLINWVGERCRFWEACLWDLPPALKAGEWGLCCDVMEHIPPEKVDLVLQNISSRVLKEVLFSIYLEEDRFGKELGIPLHLTLQSKDWWQTTLERHFDSAQCLMETDAWVIFEARQQYSKP